jgi:DNA polymerase-3 subunit delta'
MARKSAAEAKEEEAPPLHPKLTEHLIAHAAAEKQLLDLIQARRLPHALLLTGPRGIGKATLAWRLARFLLAPQETGGSLFGDALPPESLHVAASHSTFRRLAAGAHPDFLVLETEDIKVEEARSVAAFLALTPAEGEWRVVIIDSADAMNRNAANALLKTLEEPPARAVIILVSHNPGALLPTIRSRCRTLRIPPLEPAEFSRVMGVIAPDTTPQQAQVFALLSGGSPGVALELQAVRADTIYQELVERVMTPDTLKNHAFAERFARKENAVGFQVLCRLFLRLLKRIAAQGEGPEVYPGEHAALARLRSMKPLDTWLDLWERASKLFSDAEHLYLDKKQVIITSLKAAAE